MACLYTVTSNSSPGLRISSVVLIILQKISVHIHSCAPLIFNKNDGNSKKHQKKSQGIAMKISVFHSRLWKLFKRCHLPKLLSSRCNSLSILQSTYTCMLQPIPTYRQHSFIFSDTEDKTSQEIGNFKAAQRLEMVVFLLIIRSTINGVVVGNQQSQIDQKLYSALLL